MHAEMNGASELSRQMQRRMCPMPCRLHKLQMITRMRLDWSHDGVLTARPGSAVA
jgi:hypothetical protein